MPRDQEGTVVGTFWDYENCSPSQFANGFEIVSAIRKVAAKHGPIRQFRAYKDADRHPASSALRADLQSSGVSLIDCPHNNMKDVVDKMLIVDVMAFSREHPSATVILITGDRDYAYMISYLRNCLHYVIVITPGPRYLGSHASEIIEWKSLMPPPRPRPAAYIPPNGPPFFSYDSNTPQYQVPNTNIITPHSQSEGLLRPIPIFQPQISNKSPTRIDSFYRPPESSAVVITADASNRVSTSKPIEPVANEPVRSDSVPTASLSESDRQNEAEEFELQLALSIPLPRSPGISPRAITPCPSTTVSTEDSSIEEPSIIARPPEPGIKGPARDVDKLVNDNGLLHLQAAGAIRSFTLDNERLKDLFGPLIRCLLELEAKGTNHPLRAVVAEALIKQKPNPYLKCKASNWSEYSKMAEAAGVVILGTDPELQGREWVELKHTFKSSSWKSRSKPAPEPAGMSRIPKAFKPLLQFLDANYREGRTKLMRSMACEHLLRNNRGLFEKYGYNNWRDYAVAAETAGYIKLTGGGQGGGDNFISLAPKWRGQL